MTKVFHILANGETAPPANDQKGMVGCEAGGDVGIQLRGTFVATITFEGTVDKVNWIAAGAVPAAGGAEVTSGAVPGIWEIINRGYHAVRARCTAFTSGDVEVIFEPQSD